jgi:monofunctional biosynthetic peptidoglycan transglycosylase
MKPVFKKCLQFLKWIVIGFFALSIFSVIFFRFVPPPFTPLMIIRYFENDKHIGRHAIEKKWVSIEKISPNMIQAVVAAEDNNFVQHWGVDFDAIKKAQKINKYSKRLHGGSTITQQTAKNLFLWPSRSYIRKGFELYFTMLIEVFWSKERIMEVYLNIIETGKGVYGVETASRIYYKKSAAKLTRAEAAMLTTIIPNPRKRNPANPSQYMFYYQSRVLNLMDKIGKVEL